MTETFSVGARPRPYLLPRLRVAGDLLRFEACPLRYRLHGVGAWPEADAEDAPRLAGILVHAALDHAGTACRPRGAGGEGMPVDEFTASHALASASRLVDAVSPRTSRTEALQASLDASAAIARRTILDLGPHLFPFLTTTEQRLAATRLHADGAVDEDVARRRLRKVERFEVSGILDAAASGIVPSPDGGPLASLLHGAIERKSDRPLDAVIDYKLARRPRVITDGPHGADAETLRAHAFQVAAYACIRDRFAVSGGQVGIVIYLYDLFPELDSGRDMAHATEPNIDHIPIAETVRDRLSDAQSISARLYRASSVIVLDDRVVAEATARIDRIGAAIETCAEREAASVPPRLAWPTRRSDRCGECDVHPMCPAWQDTMFNGLPARHRLGYRQGELEDG